MQTFGDLANFNPHLHVLAADGVFGAEGTFIALPAVPEALLADVFGEDELRRPKEVPVGRPKEVPVGRPKEVPVGRPTSRFDFLRPRRAATPCIIKSIL